MKKIYLLLSFLVCFISAYSQVLPPTPGTAPRSNSSVIPEDYNLSVRSVFLMPRFVDTALANTYTKVGFDSCGRQIYTFTDNKVWVRKCSPKRWAEIGGVATTPTWQATLLVSLGSELLTSNTINGNDNNFVWNDFIAYEIDADDFRVDAASELNLSAGDSMRLIGIGESASTGLFIPLLNPATGALTKIPVSSFSSTPTITPSSSTSLSLTTSDYYIYTGGSTATWTLPALGGSGKRVINIKNRGSGALTVQRAGSNNLFFASSTTSVTLLTGDGYTFVDDGSFWNVL